MTPEDADTFINALDRYQDARAERRRLTFLQDGDGFLAAKEEEQNAREALAESMTVIVTGFPR